MVGVRDHFKEMTDLLISRIGVHFQSPSAQASLESLNILELKSSADTLKRQLDSKTEELTVRRNDISDFERGQLFALEAVFTHNDLLSGNVMIPLTFFEGGDSAIDQIRFIDYEYAGYNARAFDVANHFCGMHCLEQ